MAGEYRKAYVKRHKMHINPAHKGLFTEKAHAAGKSVGEYASEKAGSGGVLGKEANFARMAKRHWKPL